MSISKTFSEPQYPVCDFEPRIILKSIICKMKRCAKSRQIFMMIKLHGIGIGHNHIYQIPNFPITRLETMTPVRFHDPAWN